MGSEQPLRVTVVTVPRERFSVAVLSLESILGDTSTPFDLVYVDGGSPLALRRHLWRASRAHGFTLVARPHYLSPNAARNLGWRQATTDYVIFVDNDVVVSPGWIEPLLECADETGAAIVSPLICQGEPLHQVVHCAGGTCVIEPARRKNETGEQLTDRINGQGEAIADFSPHLRKMRTGLAEFHCVLVRTDFLREIDGLDEGLLNTREHLDLCLEAMARQKEIWLEPKSVVTYLDSAPMKLGDVYYYMLRWSDDWERRSLHYLCEKWGLGHNGSIGYRLRHLGERRIVRLVQPRARRWGAWLPPRARHRVEAGIVWMEHRFNGGLVMLNRWRVASGM